MTRDSGGGGGVGGTRRRRLTNRVFLEPCFFRIFFSITINFPSTDGAGAQMAALDARGSSNRAPPASTCSRPGRRRRRSVRSVSLACSRHLVALTAVRRPVRIRSQSRRQFSRNFHKHHTIDSFLFGHSSATRNAPVLIRTIFRRRSHVDVVSSPVRPLRLRMSSGGRRQR